MAKSALLLAEAVRPTLGEILRQRGYDVIHVLDVGRTGKSAPEQLAYAASQQRAILTHNIRHFSLPNQSTHEEGREPLRSKIYDEAMTRKGQLGMPDPFLKLSLFVHPLHPLAARRRVTLLDVLAHPLVVRSIRSGPTMTNEILRELSQAGLKYKIALRCSGP